MIGIFAYKAAALVQVYRDNEDLQFVFPENEEQSSDWVSNFPYFDWILQQWTDVSLASAERLEIQPPFVTL